MGGEFGKQRPRMLIYCSHNVENTEIVTTITLSFLCLPLLDPKLGFQSFCLCWYV